MQMIVERLNKLEKRNKRLPTAQTVMAAASCAVVTVAATGDKNDHFDRLQPPDRENTP